MTTVSDETMAQVLRQERELQDFMKTLPLDTEVHRLSDTVQVHFLPNSKLTSEIKVEVLQTVYQLIAYHNPRHSVDVYFPLNGKQVLELNPEMVEEIQKLVGDQSIPQHVLEERASTFPSGQTTRFLRYDDFGNPDLKLTLTDANQAVFLYEGLINAERRDPYNVPQPQEDELLRILAKLAGKEGPAIKPIHMYLAASIFTPLIYTLVHEWGHVLDNRDIDSFTRVVEVVAQYRETDPSRFSAFMNSLSISATNGNKETFAEAFVEYIATNGASKNEAMRTYAQVYGWPDKPFENWDFPHDVIDFKGGEVIDSATVDDNNPWKM